MAARWLFWSSLCAQSYSLSSTTQIPVHLCAWAAFCIRCCYWPPFWNEIIQRQCVKRMRTLHETQLRTFERKDLGGGRYKWNSSFSVTDKKRKSPEVLLLFRKIISGKNRSIWLSSPTGFSGQTVKRSLIVTSRRSRQSRSRNWKGHDSETKVSVSFPWLCLFLQISFFMTHLFLFPHFHFYPHCMKFLARNI